jgi:hypothetical protein
MHKITPTTLQYYVIAQINLIGPTIVTVDTFVGFIGVV